MWSQGLERAPLVVKECYASWRALNPGWQIIFLDDTNLADYVDVEAVIHPKSDVKIQARSDIIRVNLLARYGGVWADATCFCRQPLDSWLPEVTRSGFFAFSDPTRSRLIDAWFMAASPECPLIKKGLGGKPTHLWVGCRTQAAQRAAVPELMLDASA